MLPSFGSNKMFQVFFKIWEIAFLLFSCGYLLSVSDHWWFSLDGWRTKHAPMQSKLSNPASPPPRHAPLGPQLPSDSLEAAHCSLLAHSPLSPSSISPSSKHLITLSHLSSAAANARLADMSSTHLFYPSGGTYLGLVLAAFLLAQLSPPPRQQSP